MKKIAILILLTFIVAVPVSAADDISSAENAENVSIEAIDAEIAVKQEEVGNADAPANVEATESDEPSTVISFVLGQEKMKKNGVTVSIPAPAVYNEAGDRALLPIRAVSEALGYNVIWVEETSTIVISDNIKTVTLWVNYAFMAVNGEILIMDTDTVLIGESTYIPIRYVAEAFDLEVTWDEDKLMVTLTK